jgi:tetratricopeptide (TPR) repeat protein
LTNALQHRAQLKLEYDSGRTKTAAATFDSRSGNCLSLVLMTAAFAKELGLPVSYQSVSIPETWSRTGALLIASGHVNITLSRRLVDVRAATDIPKLTIDFLPPEEITGFRTHEIDERTVVAMYANNRAAEALADGHLDDAYAWAAASVRKDPGFVGAFNTLGVVYLRHGDLAEAARVFERVLAADPRDTRALANLAMAYERQGRDAEARGARTRLAALEPYPPFYFFELGMAAVQRNDWRTARELFAREVARPTRTTSSTSGSASPTGGSATSRGAAPSHARDRQQPDAQPARPLRRQAAVAADAPHAVDPSDRQGLPWTTTTPIPSRSATGWWRGSSRRAAFVTRA